MVENQGRPIWQIDTASAVRETQKLPIGDGGNDPKTTAPYKLPNSDTFSIFSSASASSSEIAKYDGFCYKGSTTSDSPENLTGFSGAITNQPQAMLMPVFQDSDELTYFFNFDIYNDGKFMGKATLTKTGSGKWMSNKLL